MTQVVCVRMGEDVDLASSLFNAVSQDKATQYLATREEEMPQRRVGSRIVQEQYCNVF